MKVTGVFVPLDPSRTDKRSAKMGWITNANGCDIWQGGRTRGYARVGGGARSVAVYRVRYEREVGPIPPGMQLDHFVCDNGPGGCCNPHHCRPVTQRENLLRGNSIVAACAARTHCPKGHPLVLRNLVRCEAAKGHRICRICRNERRSRCAA